MYLGGPCVWVEPLFKNPELKLLLPSVLCWSLVSPWFWRIPPVSCFQVSFLLFGQKDFYIPWICVLSLHICNKVCSWNVFVVLGQIVRRRLRPSHLGLSCTHCCVVSDFHCGRGWVFCYDFISCLPYWDTPHFFLLEPLMSSWHHLWHHPHLWHHSYIITPLWHHSYIITPLRRHPQNTINTAWYRSLNLTCSYLVTW